MSHIINEDFHEYASKDFITIYYDLRTTAAHCSVVDRRTSVASGINLCIQT